MGDRTKRRQCEIRVRRGRIRAGEDHLNIHCTFHALWWVEILTENFGNFQDSNISENFRETLKSRKRGRGLSGSRKIEIKTQRARERQRPGGRGRGMAGDTCTEGDGPGDPRCPGKLGKVSVYVNSAAISGGKNRHAGAT